MYKIGLEKHRKLRFGAMGRWTAIAAVLCVVILGVVKLTGSGVMKSSAAAPEAYSDAGGASFRNMSAESRPEEESAQNSVLADESKAAEKSPSDFVVELPAPEPTLAAAGGSGASGEDRASNGAPAAEYDAVGGPDMGSVYLADSLPGYDMARAALDSGDYWGVCVFYGALPEDLGAGDWQRETPESGEKDRWLLSLSELQALEKGTEWDEFYYGDLNAARGLVIVIAGEEE